MESRATCIAHQRSAIELRQPPGKQALQFCIYTGYCYATVSLSTDQPNFSILKDSYHSLNFFLIDEEKHSTNNKFEKKKKFCLSVESETVV